MVAAWVAASDDEVIGHVCLVRRDPVAKDLKLERLFVSPVSGGRGVGRALVTEAGEWAAQHEFRLSPDVVENCTEAVALYLRLGWRLTGRTPIAWGQDAADYVLHLEAPPG